MPRLMWFLDMYSHEFPKYLSFSYIIKALEKCVYVFVKTQINVNPSIFDQKGTEKSLRS